MKVFISWSGTTSRLVAEALHDWIPRVLQNAKPFLSTGDIEKGKRWNDVIAGELSESDYGIVCLTRYNCHSPWLHFEAGAISRALGKSSVSPLLFDVQPSDIDGPFRQFQMTTYSSDDFNASHGEHEIRSLVGSINQQLHPELRLTDALLREEFDRWWPDLQTKFKEIAPLRDGATHTTYPWLYAFEDLLAAQCGNASTVWWITPDPYAYVLRPEVKDEIRKRAQNSKYTFIVNAQTRNSAKKELLDLAQSNVTVVESDDSPFHEAAVTDYVVINPESELRVFLELPLARSVGPAGSEGGFWIEVTKEVAAGFRDRFETLKSDSKAKPYKPGTSAPGPVELRPREERVG